MSTAHGLELRSPFTDHKLVEMASPILAFETELTGSAADSLRLPDFASRLSSPSIGMYWRTIRPLRWSQLASLTRRRLLRPPRLRPADARGRATLRPLPLMPAFPEWQPADARQMLETRVFHFLNAEAGAGTAAPWSAAALSRLWLYHLHSCDFLNLDLTRPADRPLLERAVRLMLDWSARNATGSEIGWEPYPLSLRIVNWLKFLLRNASRLESIGAGQAAGVILASLCRQAHSLERQLEFHLRANHLLKNAKALLFAGALLETADSARWWNTGIRLLESQAAEQILADGGHFERSPMYHAQVLEDLLDLEALFTACARPIPNGEALPEEIGAMASFLAAILHPDGAIPLFNDSAFGIAPPARALLRRAHSEARIGESRNSEPTVMPQTGYAVIREPSSESCLIFDCGPLGPNEQPGHGHCDALSYELSLDGRRVVVDTGVSTYEIGRGRHYERSTAAHNTIRVDGEDQAEIWASFRVGRRPKTSPIEIGRAGRFQFLRGSHDAFRSLGAIHCRQIVHGPGKVWIVFDRLRGKGSHHIESFIHFHPAIRVEVCGSPERRIPGGWQKRLVIHTSRRRYFLVSSPLGSFTLKQAWYAPEFGRRERQLVAHWTWETALPARLLYAFLPAEGEFPFLRLSPDSDSLEIGGTPIPLG